MGSKATQLKGLMHCLEGVDDWSFDVFELEREADGLPLQVYLTGGLGLIFISCSFVIGD